MKISTRVEFGLIALADIAIYSEKGRIVSSSDIASRENISQKYLEQIILALRQGGFVRGQKGSRGGYTLTRPAEKIAFCDVLNSLDNTILADTFVCDENDHGGLRDNINSFIWNKINCYMREYTAKMTLADFIAEYKKNLGTTIDPMYYI